MNFALPTFTVPRRAVLRLLAAGSAAAVTPAVFAARARPVRYILSIPTLSVIVANQTSIPKALGYYDEEGVRVEPVLAGAAGIAGAIQLVSTGSQDMGSGSYQPMMARAAQGQDMGVAFFYSQVRSYQTVIAVQADNPARSIADLKGKLIGVPTLANEGAVIARFAAREANMNPDTEIRLIAVGSGAQAGQALRSKQVDAYVAPRSQITQIEGIGITMRSLPGSPRFKDLFGPGLFARRDYIKKHRSTVVGVGRAVAKSTVFLMTNPEAAMRLHWKIHPEQVPQGIPEEKALTDGLRVLRAQIETLRVDEQGPGNQFGYYSPQSLASLLDVFGWNSVSNPGDYFTNDLIAEINNFDRKAVIEQARSFKAA
jgi:NitT/TauT family transport system substrate-binding protein